jgi:acyl carrier protein
MDAQEQNIRSQIREFVEANMNVDDDVVLKDDDNIFRLGYVSSLMAMRLLNHIEKIAGITVEDDDIVLPNFSSVDAMVSLIGKYRSAA